MPLACLASASCGAYYGETYVGYGYTGGNYYDDVFYTPPIDALGLWLPVLGAARGLRSSD